MNRLDFFCNRRSLLVVKLFAKMYKIEIADSAKIGASLAG